MAAMRESSLDLVKKTCADEKPLAEAVGSLPAPPQEAANDRGSRKHRATPVFPANRQERAKGLEPSTSSLGS